MIYVHVDKKVAMKESSMVVEKIKALEASINKTPSIFSSSELKSNILSYVVLIGCKIYHFYTMRKKGWSGNIVNIHWCSNLTH